MKRFILVLVVFVSILSLVSCESEQDIQNNINKLRVERDELRSEVDYQKNQVVSYTNRVNELKRDVKELGLIKSGKTPRYILKLRLKQSHISLDIGKHIKDGMNAIEFELPVDKEFYDDVSIGESIVDNFRTGSLLIDGSFGNWKMKVVNKKVIY